MKNSKFLILCFCFFINISFAKNYNLREERRKNINISKKKDDVNEYEHDNEEEKVENKDNNYNKRYKKKSDMPKERFYYPYLDGSLYLKYTGNFVNKNDVDFKGSSNSFTYADFILNTNINLIKFFSLSTKMIISPITKRDYSLWVYNNDYFGNEGYQKRKSFISNYGLIMEEIFFNFTTDDLNIGMGKFNPSFAIGYDNTRYTGIIGTRFTEDYQLKEKNGIFLAAILPFFRLQVNFFTDDTTFLSDSLFTRRNKLEKNLTAGNNNRLNNFSLTTEFIIEDEYKINLGLRRLAVNQLDLTPEYGYVFGMERVIEGTNGFNILPFFESSLIKNYRGEKKRNIFYTTLNVPFVYDNWSFTFTESLKYDRNDYLYYDKNFNYLTQFNIGYKFESGFMFDISKVYGREYIKTIDGITNLANPNTPYIGGENTKITADSIKKKKSSLDSWNFMISYIYQFR